MGTVIEGKISAGVIKKGMTLIMVSRPTYASILSSVC